MNEQVLWVWLQHGLGAGASKHLRILENFGTLEDFYQAGERGWRLEGYFTERELLRLQHYTLEQAQAQIVYAASLGQRVLTPNMSTYPQCLRNIHNYPCALYMKGTLPPVDFMLSIAIVGTRRATRSGCTVAHTFGYELARTGAVIVSGGALGIDTQAHRGAVEVGGRSICVLGCGIDADYLLTNASLREAVAVDGALISEYPPGTPAMSSNFPIRNRIISGLCDATVVVEAAARSGSLITANCALDQGRDVFAVPGNVQSTMSRGTNALIRDGCPPATCALDVLHYYEEKYKLYLPTDPGVNVQMEKPPVCKHQLPANLTADAAALYAALTAEPCPLDELCSKTTLPPAQVLAAATELELCGMAQASAGQRYAIL